MRMHVTLPVLLLSLLHILPAHAVSEGEAAPQCTLNQMDARNTPVDWKKQFAGKVVYVDFWASWCGPCIQSMPFMEQMANDFRNRGFEVITVNLDEEREAAEVFLKQHPVKLRSVRDAEGNCALDYGVQAMPSSYLLDREGKVREIFMGFNPDETASVREKVQRLLAEKPQPSAKK